MDIIGGIILLLIGVFSAVQIFVPRLRISWRGTNVRSGPVTCIAFAIVFTTGGIITLFRPSETVMSPPYGVAIGLGFLCAILGFVSDFRNAKRRDKASADRPTSPKQ